VAAAIALYVAASCVVWLCKFYALYQTQDQWSDFSFFYVAAVAAISSWIEFLVVAALASFYWAATRGRAVSRILGVVLKGVALAALIPVLLINYVNAELLPTLGAPLTLSLINFSDVFASEHGRAALWSWVSADILVFGMLLVAAALLVHLVTNFAVRRPGAVPTLALLVMGTGTIVAAGITHSPTPPNFAKSGTLVFAESLRSTPYDLAADEPAAPPFTLSRVEPALAKPSAKVRNVIVIVLEAAAAQYLDVYGGKFGITPNLASRSDQSLIFENAYAQSTSSTVSLRTILSGRYQPLVPHPRGSPERDGRSALPLLPEALDQAGVRTAFFHSSDVEFGRAKAFLEQGRFGVVRSKSERRCAGDAVFRGSDRAFANDDRCTFADLTRWLDESPDSSHFAMLWTFQSHYPYFTGDDRHLASEKSLPVSKRSREGFRKYLGALREADALIGSLIEHLERSGRFQDTIIIVTGDHGQAFGQHGTYGNGTSVDEESVHVPLILIGSRLAAGRDSRLTGHIDVAPTVMDMMRLPVPGGWDGASLFGSRRERPVYFANLSSNPVIGYRVRDRKVIADFASGEVEVYDLAADPGEQADLSGKLSKPALDRQRRWIAGWARSTNQRWR